MSEPTPLLIPSETQVREFDAKLLLACVAAERGLPSIVGSRHAIHLRIDRLPRGIYLAKDFRRSALRIFRILRQLGHRIVGWDEEGLVSYTPEHYYRSRIEPESMALVDHIFAWGEANARLLRTWPGYAGTPVYPTGNPRIDMIRPELRGFYDDEVARLRERFGPFILVNTNFGHLNHFVARLSIHGPNAKTDGGDPFRAQLMEFRYAIFCEFIKMLPALAETFPDRSIVVRPHPAEHPGVWREAAGRYGNVHVIFEGSVVPWLSAAEVLVHNGCTTAVESAVLGTPVLAFKPRVSERFDCELPDSLSQEAGSLEDLFRALLGILERRAAPGAGPARALRRHLAGLDGPLAAERVVDVLEELARDPAPPPRRADVVRARAHAAGRAAVKQMRSLGRGNKNSAEYQHHRFPGITPDEVEERIGRFRALLGRFESVGVRPLARDVFEVSAGRSGRGRAHRALPGRR